MFKDANPSYNIVNNYRNPSISDLLVEITFSDISHTNNDECYDSVAFAYSKQTSPLPLGCINSIDTHSGALDNVENIEEVNFYHNPAHPFCTIFLNAEKDKFIMKLYNGKYLFIPCKDELQSSPYFFENFVSRIDGIILPSKFHGSGWKSELECESYFIRYDGQYISLESISRTDFSRSFESFRNEIRFFEDHEFVELQIVEYLNMLISGSSDYVSPTQMRHVYNSFKQLLKDQVSLNILPFFVHYSRFCDRLVGLLSQAWIYMQNPELKSRSNYKAFTLLHQISINPRIFPKQAAFVYFSLGRLQKSNAEAINLYTKSIELDSRNTYTYNNRASRYKSFAPELSIKDYTTAINLDATDPHLYYNRALLYKRCSQNQEAHMDFTTVIELEPDNYKAYYFRAQVNQLYLHDYSVALHDYTYIINHSDNRQLLVKAYFSRGSLYATHLNQPALALDDFDRALELNPQYSNALYNRKHLIGRLCKLTCIGNL